jgi:hypothetical protein
VEHRHDPKRDDGNIVGIVGQMAAVQWLGWQQQDLCHLLDLRRVALVVDGVPAERVAIGISVERVHAMQVTLFGGRPAGWYHYRDSRGEDRYTMGDNNGRTVQLVREAPGVWSCWEVQGQKVYRVQAAGPLDRALGALREGALLWRPIPWDQQGVDQPVTPRQRQALKQWQIRRDVESLSMAEATALIKTKIAKALVDRARARHGKVA